MKLTGYFTQPRESTLHGTKEANGLDHLELAIIRSGISVLTLAFLEHFDDGYIIYEVRNH